MPDKRVELLADCETVLSENIEWMQGLVSHGNYDEILNSWKAEAAERLAAFARQVLDPPEKLKPAIEFLKKHRAGVSSGDGRWAERQSAVYLMNLEMALNLIADHFLALLTGGAT